MGGVLSFVVCVCVFVPSVCVSPVPAVGMDTVVCVWLGRHSNDKCFCILSAHLYAVVRTEGTTSSSQLLLFAEL